MLSSVIHTQNRLIFCFITIFGLDSSILISAIEYNLSKLRVSYRYSPSRKNKSSSESVTTSVSAEWYPEKK